MKTKNSVASEAVVSQCQPRHNIMRDVIEEDHPQSKPAEEIEPEITFHRSQ